MSFFDDEIEQLYRGWLGKPAHPNSPCGGGGAGGFRQAGPLGVGSNCGFSSLPHPDYPAGMWLTPEDITEALNNRFQLSTTELLRKGAKGSDVRILQKRLQEYNYPIIADGNFGSKTDLAVRAFQRKKGLLPDGIVGLKTRHALGITDKTGSIFITTHDYTEFIRLIGEFIAEPASVARNQPSTQSASSPASKLHISPEGLRFIYSHEARENISNHLHWPKDTASGVTLGPGYDMKQRTPASIVTDMLAIGLDLATAKKIAEGAGKKGADADNFAKTNKELVNLTREQQMQLLAYIVPSYEKIVSKNITVDLVQHEFDALVSFAYNPGSAFSEVAHYINQGHIAQAMKTIKSVVTSKSAVIPGLVKRRNDEISLYLYGYEHLHH